LVPELGLVFFSLPSLAASRRHLSHRRPPLDVVLLTSATGALPSAAVLPLLPGCRASRPAARADRARFPRRRLLLLRPPPPLLPRLGPRRLYPASVPCLDAAVLCPHLARPSLGPPSAAPADGAPIRGARHRQRRDAFPRSPASPACAPRSAHISNLLHCPAASVLLPPLPAPPFLLVSALQPASSPRSRQPLVPSRRALSAPAPSRATVGAPLSSRSLLSGVVGPSSQPHCPTQSWWLRVPFLMV
jgi:hypothetical protein